MVRKLVNLFTLVTILCVTHSLNATHIVGGEMYYDYLGNNQYRITLKVYKDCSPGVTTPFDDPAYLTIFNSNNIPIQTLQLNLPPINNVPFTPGNPCFIAPPNVCVQEAIYTTVVTLTASPMGYTFAYQRCCRNNTILNIIDPGGTGATYMETVPNNAIAPNNSSPRFKNFPPIALCVGDSLIFDHSATDPDGDSLVYEFIATYDGATAANPMPMTASSPPFTPILFQAPFSVNNPISSNPQASIDPHTGILKVYPTQQGQFVVGVVAKEYRNGILIGTHMRDFQFNVTQCAVNTVAQFNIPSFANNMNGSNFVSCGQLQVTFDNTSLNSSYYHWDFGVPGTNTDVSSAFEPTFTFPSFGTYNIMLVTNPGYFCADTTYQTLIIRPEFDPQINNPAPQCLLNNSFNFTAGGTYEPAATFTWNFAGPVNTPTANGINVNNISWSDWGDFTVTLTGNQYECQEIRTTTIKVIGPITPSWEIDTSKGCVPHTAYFTYTGTNSNASPTYLWNFGNGQTSNSPNPSVLYNVPGIYDVSLFIHDPTGCTKDTLLLLPQAIVVNDVPTADFILTPETASVYLSLIRFFDQSIDAETCLYDFGDGTTSTQFNTTHEYLDGGRYWVTQTVTNLAGCTDTAMKPVYIKPEYSVFAPNTFSPNGDNKNPTFAVKGIGIDSFHIFIFNRWGEKVFESDDIKVQWNGRKHNKEDNPISPIGTYVYRIVTRDVFGEQHEYFGHINLIQ